MSNIPTQQQNPKGLHARYYIQKIIPLPQKFMGLPADDSYKLEQVDENAEYFIMRLDEGGKDAEHIKACRIGVNAYADAIEHHLPELAKDLRERYPSLSAPSQGEATPLLTGEEIEKMAEEAYPIMSRQEFGFSDKAYQCYLYKKNRDRRCFIAGATALQNKAK